MKTLMYGWIALLFSPALHAATENIYGWDIHCVGSTGMTVHAYQSDDDFYIATQGPGATADPVWADTSELYSTELRVLRFKSDPKGSHDPAMELEIEREPVRRFEFARGEITIEGDRQNVNCYVRFGADEEGFDRLKNLPFPKISRPSR